MQQISTIATIAKLHTARQAHQTPIGQQRKAYFVARSAHGAVAMAADKVQHRASLCQHGRIRPRAALRGGPNFGEPSQASASCRVRRCCTG